MIDRQGHRLDKAAHFSACVEGRHVKAAFCRNCNDVVEVRGSWPPTLAERLADTPVISKEIADGHAARKRAAEGFIGGSRT